MSAGTILNDVPNASLTSRRNCILYGKHVSVLLISVRSLTFALWVLPFYSVQHLRYQVPLEEELVFGVSDRYIRLSRSH